MMSSAPQILIVDDDPIIHESWPDLLEREGYGVSRAMTGEEAVEILSAGQQHNLALVDLRLPGMNGIELLEKIKADFKDTAVIIITAYGSIPNAVEAMKKGAIDYLSKPVNPEELLIAINKYFEHQQLIRQNIYLMGRLKERYDTENIVGRSAVMQEILGKVNDISVTDSPVLICGESGTGKELIANHIHYASPRSKGPLISFSCATLSTNLIESELFGHEKGAYTGATEQEVGRFELANNGTLFLDEVGDIPLSTQAKILRVLQSKEFERVGGTKTIKSDFRLITATNRDLVQMTKKGLLRKDLYYRLNVVEIELPPLRARKDDIPLLFEHFVKVFRAKTSKPITGGTEEVLRVLQDYHWPGNVRELKNLIERAFVFCKENLIGVEYLPRYVYSDAIEPTDLSHLPTRSVREIEKRLIELCLWEANGNHSAAAKSLGITRTTLLSKMRLYHLR